MAARLVLGKDQALDEDLEKGLFELLDVNPELVCCEA